MKLLNYYFDLRSGKTTKKLMLTISFFFVNFFLFLVIFFFIKIIAIQYKTSLVPFNSLICICLLCIHFSVNFEFALIVYLMILINFLENIFLTKIFISSFSCITFFFQKENTYLYFSILLFFLNTTPERDIRGKIIFNGWHD